MVDAGVDSSYDSWLSTLATVSSRWVDSYCGRKAADFAANTVSTKYFDGTNSPNLNIGELAEPPSLVATSADGIVFTDMDNTQYSLYPNEPPYTILVNLIGVWTRGFRTVKVAGKFGYSVNPPLEIQMATIIQTVRLFKRGQQAFQDGGMNLELGKLIYATELDPDVKQLLDRYRKVSL